MSDQVRCEECGRGATYRRIDANPWFWVRLLYDGSQIYVCGYCLDKLDPADVDHLCIILGHSPSTIRYRPVELSG